MSIDEVADELYALAPEDFTAARDDAVKAADGGDRKAVKTLRKPTMPAYAVNLLARERRDDVEALVGLGDELRGAMTGGGDVRGLSEQRRELVRSLVHAASDVTGRELTAAVEADVAATLEAATADPDLGAAVLSGRLVKPLRYAGFGTLPDLGDAVATPLPNRTAARKTASKTDRTAGQPARTAAKTSKPSKTTQRPDKAGARKPTEGADAAELTRQRSKVLALAGEADDAQRRYELASRAVVEARQQLDRAEKERAEAHRAASAAHKEVEKARRELGRLERR